MKDKNNKNFNPLGTSNEGIETSLNPRFSLGLENDVNNPAGKDYLTGDSVNEHQMTQQANEYIAEEEIKQQLNNL